MKDKTILKFTAILELLAVIVIAICIIMLLFGGFNKSCNVLIGLVAAENIALLIICSFCRGL